MFLPSPQGRVHGVPRNPAPFRQTKEQLTIGCSQKTNSSRAEPGDTECLDLQH